MMYKNFAEYMQKNGSKMKMNGMASNNGGSLNSLTGMNVMENPEPFAMTDENSGEISVAGIVNVKYEITEDGTFNVSANIANLFDVGSFSLNFNNPMINFTQGNSFVGYSLTFGVDYDKKEFYFEGYVKIPFISPFETGRFVLYSW